MKYLNNILVAGGAGFIGSNLCKRLLENENNFVICIDNLYTGRLENIKYFLKNKNFIFINHDITTSLNNLTFKVNEIYNLACPASPNFYQGSHSIETTKTCIYGSVNLLEIAKRDNAKILFTSTSEVYGEPLQHPQVEEYRGNVNPIGIRACYDEGKRCAESLYFDYKRNFNLDIKIVRIFNTYGTNMRKDDGRVISNFINQMLENKDITIYGDGTQTRSFCFVDDMINALILMMKSKYSGPFNLGNPEEFTINDLVDKLLTLIDTKSNIVFKDLPKDDPTKRRPNINKAKEFLKWQPNIKLNEGLIKTIEYYRNAK